MRSLKVALIGNPNSGKTTIFNLLTKSHQKIGNYPGVTVEKKEGFVNFEDFEITIIDLPGTYSLSHYTSEEIIARNALFEEKPDLIVNIVDAANLERSLFLTTQLIEMGLPLLIFLNMMDVVERKKMTLDIEMLSQLLEVKIVEVAHAKKKSFETLLKAIIEPHRKVGAKIPFSHEIEEAILAIEPKHISSRFIALKLLEGDETLANFLNLSIEKAQIKAKEMEKKRGSFFEIFMAEERYNFISAIINKIVKRSISVSLTDKVDSLLLNKWLGLPLFFLFLLIIFEFTFKIGSYPSSWIRAFFYFLNSILPKESLLSSFIGDGIFAGVGAVLSFLPNILILFFALTLLEESGYMARAAFLMDKLMHKIGLHGKSFIPMLLGLGCSVPAIMSTKTLESKKDRMILILTLPLIACSAKFTLFTMLTAAFFTPFWGGIVLFSLYIIGFLLSITAIKILKKFVFKGDEMPFILELPEYHLPSFTNVVLHLWWLTRQYLKKAGNIILLFSMLLWLLNNFPSVNNSFMMMAGKTIEPLFYKTLGFDWIICTALIASFAAKEIFISQLSILFSLSGQWDITKALHENYSASQAYILMLFLLISLPCLATFAVTKKETHSWKWAALQFFSLTFLAFFISFLASLFIKIGE